jgi:transposase InsO family protein
MRAKLLREKLEGLPADHEFIPVRTPNKNAHIESFFSIYDKHLQEQYFLGPSRCLGMSPNEFSRRRELHSQEKFMQAI